ncbi:MAG: acetylornithine/succinylornithine family transaminase [Nitrososphaerota archaeon]|uniref:aspartate aminotransferase family protein n=1 Tax=Candidatus Bathycorpusculum sp. TaxID=2994959 RepID=UPI0028242D68|nr:acetylornithine/succinylornithine family transaminase [Candidatus Termiticorpusculum sp.]MCL2256762.1 acetylornithine/succinylornithine family transaminase [Candidatus Termiticorpusculum sp.]MCL2293043.1 acetylornithine/succinylornithine family transaminase [Candidatus Termiticorpusculum sp.]MDR0460006.1 acetylornithine/succinylornithine family transaminase [Nitrososphaerota archaeon]
MNEKEIISIESLYLANVFSKKPLVFTHGKGALLWDINGKEYLDCASSYGVAALGHCHPKIVNAIKTQAESLITLHSCYYNDKRAEFIQKLVNITPKGLNKAFLSNSGAESVECAIKLARKVTGKTEIISIMGAYHGKTMGALSLTWDKKYREPFMPLIPDVKHVAPDNPDKIREAITDKTAAVIIEPIRGEGGIRVSQDNYLQQVREICNEKNVLLIFDEVQTSFGRTGKLFCCQNWNVTPDIMCLAKPFAGGLPIGITVARENLMAALKIGEHSTTFSGSPIVCAAGCAALDALIDEDLVSKAAVNGKYFKEQLETMVSKHKIVKEVRGLGLMLGIELRYDVYGVIIKALNKGVLVIDAGRTVIRILPPLIINKEQIDRAVKVLDEALGEEENERTGNTVSN